ncbi:methyltransferase family protein [Rhizobium sp. PP-CC-2G-626]|nr:methyltransferase family protein [Rhizobium sp. PP-CC-2G-626]
MFDEKTIRFYEREAKRYAAATAEQSMNEQIARFTKFLPGNALIVDLGCGGGRDLANFSRRGFNAVGLDAAFELAKIAGATSGCPVVVGDLLQMPFAKGSFDAVWASASLLHIQRNEIDHALNLINDILVAGGFFFCSMKVGRGELRTDDSRFFTYFMPSEWNERLACTGFELIESQADGFIGSEAGDRWMNTIARTVR